MRFTSNEMMFFHSITPGETVLGYRFFFPRGEKGKIEEEKTIQSLIKKGVLESKDRLAEKGFYPAKAMEDYKNSKKHIIINRLHLALPENGDMVMIYPVEEEYEMCRINSAVLLFLCIKNFPFLCGGKEDKDIIMEQPGLDRVLGELYENESNILIGEYQEQKAVRERIFYQKDNKDYIYDMVSGRRYETDGYRMRMELKTLLGIEGESFYGKE